MATRNGPMESGDRQWSVEIQSRSAADAVDASGAPQETWATIVAKIPAARHDLSARERFAYDQMSASVDTRWEINYRSDMDPELVNVPKLRRIVHRARVYDIVDASLIGRRAGIELITLAQVAP